MRCPEFKDECPDPEACQSGYACGLVRVFERYTMSEIGEMKRGRTLHRERCRETWWEPCSCGGPFRLLRVLRSSYGAAKTNRRT